MTASCREQPRPLGPATVAGPRLPRFPGSAGEGDGSDARLAPLTASLTARLGAVCRDWDPAEFRALVEQIARTQLRWADADGHTERRA